MKLSSHLRSTHNQDGAIVLDILHGQMFRLNLVASRMLELLGRGVTEERIVEDLAREFAVDPSVVACDLKEFLEHLQKHHLLETAEHETQLL